MRSEYSPKRKTSYPTYLLPWLFVRIYVFLRVLLFLVVSPWFSVLQFVPVCRKFTRKVLLFGAIMGPMSCTSIVSSTLYTLLSFKPRLLISIADSKTA